MHNLDFGKSTPKIWPTFLIKKCPQNSHIMGENSPNLVTLVVILVADWWVATHPLRHALVHVCAHSIEINILPWRTLLFQVWGKNIWENFRLSRIYLNIIYFNYNNFIIMEHFRLSCI
jgi:hypothetical protein